MARWTLWEHDPAKQAELRRKYRENMYRSRKANTLIWGFALIVWVFSIWQKRAQWPTLLHLHTWTHLSLSSVAADMILCVMLLCILCDTWRQVGQYRQEQSRLEQERQMRDAAHAPGVWPPPPQIP